MPQWQGKRKIAVVTAHVRSDGLPDFALNEVEVTQDEHANGVHYELVEAQLTGQCLEETMVHFDQFEAPPFLMAAVAEYLESRISSRERALTLNAQ
jgi:hypothetical protein